MVAALAAYPEKTMLQTPALKKVVELLLHIVWQRVPFGGMVFQKSRVVLLHQLVQQRLFRLMALVTWRVGGRRLANG